MLKKLSKNKKGLTMIELMTVIAIVGIMTAVTFVSMQSARKQKEVEAAGRQIAAILRETQNKALTGKIVSGTDYPCAFRVTLENTTSGIDYSLSSAPSTNCNAFGTYESGTISRVQLSGGAGAEIEINYGVPHAATTATSIIINSLDGTAKFAVCLSSFGNVDEQSDGTCP